MKEVTLWWLKKDFRLSDNPALTEALKTGRTVLPVFIIEPSAISSPETSQHHLTAWLDAARSLRTQLRKHGGELCVLHGEVIETFEQILKKVSLKAIYSHQETGTERTFARDREVLAWTRTKGIPWTEVRQTGVFRGLKDRDLRASYWKEWIAEGPLPPPDPAILRQVQVPSSVMDLRPKENRRLSSPLKGTLQKVDEPSAERTLSTFLHQRSLGYSTGISSPNTAFHSGSRLSVHLAWGTITGRKAYLAVQDRIAELKESDHPDAGKWRRSLSSYLARLNWRDHFIQRLETEPRMETEALNPAYDALPYHRSAKRIAAWKNAETGFPLVDACIRCAQQTGFLNFRMRCMITSVGTHAMHLDWRDLHHPMAQWWTDYEPGIHLSQLQMQAGVVGINTLRTYNPAKQIADHDPKAKFIKRWLPELKEVAPAAIISHQDEPIKGYPNPIVNWREATTEMRTAYYALKRLDATKAIAEEVLKKHGSRKKPSRNKSQRKKSSNKKNESSPK